MDTTSGNSATHEGRRELERNATPTPGSLPLCFEEIGGQQPSLYLHERYEGGFKPSLTARAQFPE